MLANLGCPYLPVNSILPARRLPEAFCEPGGYLAHRVYPSRALKRNEFSVHNGTITHNVLKRGVANGAREPVLAPGARRGDLRGHPASAVRCTPMSGLERRTIKGIANTGSQE